MKHKLLALLMAAAMTLSLAACGGGSDVPASGETPEKTYIVGVCQLAQHPALDAATEGFTDALKEALGDRVVVTVQNASGDPATAVSICGTFVSDEVDLILANATPALEAAAAATGSIPILGTSVTDYASTFDIENWNGTVGGNISGTSDLAPLEEQAALLVELLPEAKTVGLLFCSGESNSVYQADVITGHFEALGLTVKRFSFTDSSDVAAVTQSACDECDAIFIPTDNTAATCTEAIGNVAVNAGVPIIAGEEGICSGCGVATLAISYYDLGRVTGEMAAEILQGGDISTMAIRFAPEVTKKYNAALCEKYGITPPEGFVAIG